MLKNYLKIAWRSLVRSKNYALINITGLAVGLTGFIIILLYLNFELSYDKWDPSLKQVYKISLRTDEDILQTTPAPLAELLLQKLPFVEASTTMQASGDFDVLLTAGDKKIFQISGVEADSSFLQVFPFTITGADAATALNKPNAIIISEALAQKLFGQTDVVGKTIRVHNAFDCEVTGVFKEPSTPAHFNTQFVYRSPYEKEGNHWQNLSYQTYVKINKGISITKLESEANMIYYNGRLKENDVTLPAFRKAGHQAGLFADAIKDIHNFPKNGSSNFTTVTVLLLLAFLLLLAGAINFSNLSIASSVRRAKEIGIRKVLGSAIAQLRWQFMMEIALQCFIALSISIVAVLLLLPYFNKSFGIDLRLFQSDNISSVVLQIIGCLVLVILLSGLYPAFFLSKYNITKVLKGDYSRGKKGMAFRNALIVVQFAVAAFFITGTLIIRNQMQYMQNKDKGFNASQVMRLEAPQKIREQDFELTKNVLLAVPGVKMVSKTTTVPGDNYDDTSTFAFRHKERSFRMTSVKVSETYFSTLNILLLKGRMFDNRNADQNTRSAVINESAAAKLGLANVLGETITFPGCDSIPIEIVGIVKDFNIAGFENLVQPAVYTIGNKACMYQSGGGLLVKIGEGNIKGTIAGVEAAWKAVSPDMPIRYSFLDDNFQKLFAEHIRLQRMISLFSLSAIIISLMGLFALTTFLINQRTKEIGIRKILGARTIDVSVLISKDFMKLILIAVVIAMPLAWLATNEWLHHFSYRIKNSLPAFIIGPVIIIVVAIITILSQAIKASVNNPVNSLRSE
jgi:putative ABC transport system permease protein